MFDSTVVSAVEGETMDDAELGTYSGCVAYSLEFVEGAVISRAGLGKVLKVDPRDVYLGITVS